MTSVKPFAPILGQLAHLWDKLMDISAALQAWNQSLVLHLSIIWLSLKEIPSSFLHGLLKHLFLFLFVYTARHKLILPIEESVHVTLLLKTHLLPPSHNQIKEMVYVQLITFTSTLSCSYAPICFDHMCLQMLFTSAVLCCFSSDALLHLSSPCAISSLQGSLPYTLHLPPQNNYLSPYRLWMANSFISIPLGLVSSYLVNICWTNKWVRVWLIIF